MKIKNKRAIFAACVAMLCFVLTSCSNGAIETPTQTETQPTTVETTLETTEIIEEVMTDETTAEVETELESTESIDTISFELVAGEYGEYGKELIYNDGTEFEDKRVAYYVPYGTYKITNIGEYMTQVNIYSDEKQITEEGWEEHGDGNVKLIDVEANEEMTIPSGYHIEISEPTHLLLEMISAE